MTKRRRTVASSAVPSVLLGKVSDASAAYSDATVLFVGHSMTGGAADLQDAVEHGQSNRRMTARLVSNCPSAPG